MTNNKLTGELNSELVLKGMPSEFIDELASLFSKQVFDEKERFINKESTIDTFYMILSGTVTISYTLENNKEMVKGFVDEGKNTLINKFKAFFNKKKL